MCLVSDLTDEALPLASVYREATRKGTLGQHSSPPRAQPQGPSLCFRTTIGFAGSCLN
jgi:hypothetical protein